MSKKVIHVVPGLLLSMLLPALITAQAPPAAPAKPDSAEVKQHIEKAKKIAGTDWAGEANFFCLMPRAKPGSRGLELCRVLAKARRHTGRVCLKSG